MAFADDLLAAALQEWRRWGFSIRPLHGRQNIVGKEYNDPYTSYVNDYWKVVGHPTWNGLTKQPWSAAFISFCFKTAGAKNRFPYDPSHAGYCAAIVNQPRKYPLLQIVDPGTAKLELGDLIWAGRTGDRCPRPPSTYAAAISALRRGQLFCSHADIVVELRDGEVDVIGGNVSDSVTKSTYKTVEGVIRDPRHTWIGVVKNTISDNQA